MICQNCHTEVDDDLIFCTNCGARLFQPGEETPTVLLNDPTIPGSQTETLPSSDPRATRPENPKPPKTSSNLKWVALIVALIAIPASIFGILLLQSRNRQVAQNNNRPPSPSPTPTRTANANRNTNVNSNVNSNVNANKPNAVPSPPKPPKKEEIMDERIEIAPKEHYAVPFEVNSDTARINGEVRVLEGERIDGFVYLKKSYDEYFPDEKHKMFSFGGTKTVEVRQTLVKEAYVLIFVNNSDKPITAQGNFWLE
jgi:hypothetical protein